MLKVLAPFDNQGDSPKRTAPPERSSKDSKTGCQSADCDDYGQVAGDEVGTGT